jgi:hypothetical protein
MKGLLILWSAVAVMGIATMMYSNHVLSSVQFKDNTPVMGNIDLSGSMTPSNYQLQPAIDATNAVFDYPKCNNQNIVLPCF